MSSRSFKRPIILACLVLGRAASCWAAGPDVYDDIFHDDARLTTLNFLEPGLAQQHAIHSAGDEDWIIFPTRLDETAFYTVTVDVPAGASMINPTVSLLDDAGTTLTTDCFTGDPGPRDCEALGQDEVITISLAPGIYYLRIAHAGAIHGDDASYTVVVGADIGANNGITSTIANVIGPQGGGLASRPGEGGPPAPHGGMSPFLYSRRSVVFAGPPVPSLSRDQVVTLGPPFDIYNPTYPSTVAWLGRTLTNRNYSIVRLQIGDSPNRPGILDFPTPVELTLEAEDDEVMTPAIGLIDDIPAGYDPALMRVMIWSPAAAEWQVFDPAPERVGERLFKTSMSSIAGRLGMFAEVYFALEPIPPNAAREWKLYE